MAACVIVEVDLPSGTEARQASDGGKNGEGGTHLGDILVIYWAKGWLEVG